MSIRSRKVDLDKVLGQPQALFVRSTVLLRGSPLACYRSLGWVFFAALWFDLLFIGLALSVGLIAVPMGYRRHGRVAPALFFIGGLASIVLGHFVFGHESVLGTVLSVWQADCAS